MRGLNSETFDLIYLDPPFNSKRDYAAPIGSQAEGAAFEDTWTLDDVKEEWAVQIEASNPGLWHAVVGAGHTADDSMQAYLTFMAVRLIEMRRLLKDTGSIYLHCDPHASHYLKQLMDAVFGYKQFRNEIIWRIGWISGFKSQKRGWIRNHDTLLYYIKTDAAAKRFNKEYIPYPPDYVRRDGKKPTGKGVPIEDTWNCSETDTLHSIMIMSFSGEKQGYPTQKPLALMDRIIKASSNKGDMVLDPFCGCATTCVAAEKLERQWVGIDIEKTAAELVVSRLNSEAEANPLLKDWWKSDDPPITHRRDIPKRTDSDAPTRSPDIKKQLHDKQNGRCNGLCGDDKQGRKLDIDLFEIDHIKPRSKGGADVDENLQLLCSTCNGRKGNRTMQKLLELNFKERAAVKAEEAAAKLRASQASLDLG